jgi:uncharacterized protein YjbJ (UPF0337 family)
VEAVGTGDAVAVNQASFGTGIAFLERGPAMQIAAPPLSPTDSKSSPILFTGIGILSARGMVVPLSEIAKDSTIRRKQMKPSTTDEIKGTFHEVKGKVKEKAGQVTNNPDLKAKGKAENIAGKVEKKVGQIEKVLEK